jgi:hypothetical protein
MSLRSRVWLARGTDNLAATSELSRQCGIFNISQPFRPPHPVRVVALLYPKFMDAVLNNNNLWFFHRLCSVW